MYKQMSAQPIEEYYADQRRKAIKVPIGESMILLRNVSEGLLSEA